MTTLPRDPVHQRIVLGTALCFAKAVERARQTNTLLVFWRDGHVVEVHPDDIAAPVQANTSPAP